jgi:hypothetical protein
LADCLGLIFGRVLLVVGRHPDVFGGSGSLLRPYRLVIAMFSPLCHAALSPAGLGAEETRCDTSNCRHNNGQGSASRFRIVISVTAEERKDVSEKGQEITS